jgi:hypothetical protein
VRITAQLIRAATDTHLWAESYERDARDVLTLQAEVAQAIAREINVALTPEESTHLARAHPLNPEAYEAYLKGQSHWYWLSREHLDTAWRGATPRAATREPCTEGRKCWLRVPNEPMFLPFALPACTLTPGTKMKSCAGFRKPATSGKLL